MVGLFYIMGYGVDPSNKQATNYYQKAADQGYADAQYNLARQYQTGSGIEKSTELAIKWFNKAAAQGSEEAKKELAELVPVNSLKGFSLYDRSKGLNNEKATLTQEQINKIVKEGYVAFNDGDYSKALEIWLKAAEAGNATAQTNLGIQYSYSFGTKLNKEKALYWLNKA